MSWAELYDETRATRDRPNPLTLHPFVFGWLTASGACGHNPRRVCQCGDYEESPIHAAGSSTEPEKP